MNIHYINIKELGENIRWWCDDGSTSLSCIYLNISIICTESW